MNDLKPAVQRYITAVQNNQIPDKRTIKAVFGDADAGVLAGGSIEWAKRMLPLARLDAEAQSQVNQEYFDSIQGWSKLLDGAGIISTSFCTYLKVDAILKNRGKDFKFSPAFIAVMQVNCNLGGYGIPSAKMIKDKRNSILAESFASITQ